MGCLHLTYNLLEIFGDVLHMFKSAKSSPKRAEIIALHMRPGKKRYCEYNNNKA